MGNFQYAVMDGQTRIWADVPLLARPDADSGSVIVIYPDATSWDGQGYTCGAFGVPRIEITAERMLAGAPPPASANGLRWWQAYFAAEGDHRVAIAGITAYNPRRGAWVGYTGWLNRPQIGRIDASRPQLFATGIKIIVDHLAEVTWP